ncbi:Sm-like ribonucleoprotein [Hypoxylon fuscum]|nr:Sm-like ribonucleoprotein [Hypoxylon fuscum]
MDKAAAKEEAEAFLTSLLNKNLRVYTTDGRLFHGTFKCTDTDRNVVLSLTYEYRRPSKLQLAEAAAEIEDSRLGTVTAEMPSRYLGLVVVPGAHIVKIEVEEFASQVKSRSIFQRRDLYGGS